MNRYTSISFNKSGLLLCFDGETKKSVLNQFKNKYKSSGFRISIFDNSTGNRTVIKSTYR